MDKCSIAMYRTVYIFGHIPLKLWRYLILQHYDIDLFDALII